MTRRLLTSMLFGVVLFAQQPADPSQPFPNHEQPPKNWFCYPADAHHDPAHDPKACTCLGMREKPDPEKLCTAENCEQYNDNGDCVAYRRPNDNSQCKAYCHKENCACDTQCEM